MKITKRIYAFIDELLDASVSDTDTPGYKYYLEYTDQVANNDYYYICCYAEQIGVKIPRALKDWKTKNH